MNIVFKSASSYKFKIGILLQVFHFKTNIQFTYSYLFSIILLFSIDSASTDSNFGQIGQVNTNAHKTTDFYNIWLILKKCPPKLFRKMVFCGCGKADDVLRTDIATEQIVSVLYIIYILCFLYVEPQQRFCCYAVEKSIRLSTTSRPFAMIFQRI